MVGIVILLTMVYGAGLALVMFWLFDTITSNVANNRLVNDLLKTLGSFVGSTAVTVTTFLAFDLDQLTGIPHAKGWAILGSLAGFGVAAIGVYVKSVPSSKMRLFWAFVAEDDLHVLLLRMNYNASEQDIADSLNLTLATVRRRYLAAMRKIR